MHRIHGDAVANDMEGVFGGLAEFNLAQARMVLQPRQQQGGVGRLGDEIDRAQRQRMLDVDVFILAGQHQRFDAAVFRQQIANQRKTFFR